MEKYHNERTLITFDCVKKFYTPRPVNRSEKLFFNVVSMKTYICYIPTYTHDPWIRYSKNQEYGNFLIEGQPYIMIRIWLDFLFLSSLLIY